MEGIQFATHSKFMFTYALDKLAATGAYHYEDGCRYFGDWNQYGQKHGFGHLVLPDSSRYDGTFHKGHFFGLGVLQFPDGARYEGEFEKGWFHGYGVFHRKDGMKYEGEFCAGRVSGHGLVTYNDGSHGFPRNEGLFLNCRMVYRKNCEEVIHKAQKCAFMARAQFEERSRLLKGKT